MHETRPCTGFLSLLRAKLRDGAVWPVRGGCYTWAALASNDSKTRYIISEYHTSVPNRDPPLVPSWRTSRQGANIGYATRIKVFSLGEVDSRILNKPFGTRGPFFRHLLLAPLLATNGNMLGNPP